MTINGALTICNTAINSAGLQPFPAPDAGLHWRRRGPDAGFAGRAPRSIRGDPLLNPEQPGRG